MATYQPVPAAERTLQLLEQLATAPEGLSAGELERRLEIPRSVLYGLLNTLRQRGYVEQPVPRGPYLPGPRLAVLATPTGPRTLAALFAAETGRAFPETAVLMVLDGDEAVVVAEAPANHTVRAVYPVGLRLPAGHCAGGQVLLAGHVNPGVLDQVQREAAVQHRRADVVELAVPICADGIHADAALVLVTPAFRWQEERRDALLFQLRAIAARISHRLGAVAYHPYRGPESNAPDQSIPLDPGERDHFLAGPWAARLACVRPDGQPHVVPVWYEWREGAFWIAAWPDSRWARYVAANAHVALTVDEPWPPLRRVLARGPAEACPAADVGLFQRISARYLGPAGGAPQSTAGWRAFRIVPHHLSAWRQP